MRFCGSKAYFLRTFSCVGFGVETVLFRYGGGGDIYNLLLCGLDSSWIRFELRSVRNHCNLKKKLHAISIDFYELSAL